MRILLSQSCLKRRADLLDWSVDGAGRTPVVADLRLKLAERGSCKVCHDDRGSKGLEDATSMSNSVVLVCAELAALSSLVLELLLIFGVRISHLQYNIVLPCRLVVITFDDFFTHISTAEAKIR